MDPRLLAYYEQELRYLREQGAEFAEEYPQIARRLGLTATECADPGVERLLEGFAFLAARIQLKLDAEFPRFTEHLLEVVYPHYLAPTPAVGVARFSFDPRQSGLVDGFTVARGTLAKVARPGPGGGMCLFQTGQDVQLLPLEVTEARHTSNLTDLDLSLEPRGSVQSTLRIRLRTLSGAPVGALNLANLPLFIDAPGSTALKLFELCHGAARGVWLKGAQGQAVRAPGVSLRTKGFDDTEGLLPPVGNTFQGYRLLQEYFALPQRFLFIELTGLRQALREVQTDQVELVIALGRHDVQVETSLVGAHLAPFCVPVVNLFERRCDRILLESGKSEFHLVADRTRPLDYEIHTIGRISGHREKRDSELEFLPFYRSSERAAATANPAGYYTVRREPRRRSRRERDLGARLDYVGNEVFLSLVNREGGPPLPQIEQLSVTAWCTNRDLPIGITTGSELTMDSGAPATHLRFVAGPSRPRPAASSGVECWRAVSHLALNFQGLADSLESGDAHALRELLTLYAPIDDAAAQRQIMSVQGLSVGSVVRKLPLGNGPSIFGRGLEVRLDCDETGFEGSSPSLLASVLERFFARYAGINSFTETVLRTRQRGEVMRWPPRTGRGRNL